MVVRSELPSHFRIHNVFHVSLLKPRHISGIPSLHPSPPPPIQLSTGEEYEVDRILDSRLFLCQLQYLVLWKDFVCLLRHNIATTHPCSKLDYKKLDPFRIIEKIGCMVVRLELPSQFRIHNVFHVSLLEPRHISEIPGRHPSPPPPI